MLKFESFQLPFVYKRLEYYPNNLMDISNCQDNHLRLRKYVANVRSFERRANI